MIRPILINAAWVIESDEYYWDGKNWVSNASDAKTYPNKTAAEEVTLQLIAFERLN